MLEIAAFARVEFKNLPLARVQAAADEKFERALRKFLQPADGRFQNRPVKFFCELLRKIFLFIRFAQTTHCVIIFVAMSDDGCSVTVPGWKPQTEEDLAMERYAKKLMDLRKGIEEEVKRLQDAG